ncbi:hypothetical protein [Singulisphaera sp. PoT]|uniref:hypothetical protein n=1 Tax=Singulisphaera sp. PoT TaxID=3411797 RepID=UPI003BF547B1
MVLLLGVSALAGCGENRLSETASGPIPIPTPPKLAADRDQMNSVLKSKNRHRPSSGKAYSLPPKPGV